MDPNLAPSTQGQLLEGGSGSERSHWHLHQILASTHLPLQGLC